MSKTRELSRLVEAAASGRTAELDVSDMRPLGNRATWYGVAKVHSSRVLRSSMAHATSLAKAVTDIGLCEPYAKLVFTFSINAHCRLQVRASEAVTSRPDQQPIVAVPSRPLSPPTGELPSVDNNSLLDPDAACETVHRLTARLPRFLSTPE